MSSKIGLMDENVAKLKGGPKVFMGRLKEALEKKGIYDGENFEKWLNLSFRKIPNYVLEKKDNCEIIIRFDGIWNDSLIPSIRYFDKTKNFIDLMLFKRINKVILDNYELSDKVIYQSKFSKFTIEKLLFERFGVENRNKKSIIIYNGVDLEKFKPMPQCKTGKNFPNILISHRLIPFKRAHQSVEIIKKLKEIYPNLKVHVVGGGIKNPYHLNQDTKKHFIKEVEKNGLMNYYEFYGHIEPNKLPEFYNKCDFMLNLSYADPCPNVVVEAIACGLPVVAPNTGGISELVRCKDLLVEENINMNEFQSRFNYKDLPIAPPELYVKVIKNTVENLEKYSQIMRKTAEENYDISEVAGKYIDFIN